MSEIHNQDTFINVQVKTPHRRSKKEAWVEVGDFANDFAADLAKFSIVLIGLLLLSYVFRLVKLGGLLDSRYVEILEKIDFAADLAVILVLVIDSIGRLTRSLWKSK